MDCLLYMSRKDITMTSNTTPGVAELRRGLNELQDQLTKVLDGSVSDAKAAAPMFDNAEQRLETTLRLIRQVRRLAEDA